ncbi:MAG: glycosyltransferase family 4 protein [Deltaproteobacteria bacterium]|nr:glycosyltransferase family 4 protein [Deltaproteobacteria bacterium]
MRLAFFYDKTSGGLPKISLDIAKALADRCHAVLACGPIKSHRCWAKSAYEHGVILAEGPSGGFLSLPRSIIRRITEFGPELIVSGHRGCDVRASNLAHKIGVPHVAIIHGNPNSMVGLQNPSIPLLWFRNLIWRQALRRACKIVCVSRWIMAMTKDFLGNGKDLITTILNGVPLSDYTWAKQRSLRGVRRPRRLLAVGRICREKRPDLFVDLVRKARDLGCDVTGQWLGEGELLDEVRARAIRFGISPFVHLPGHSFQPVSYYKDADLLVHFCTHEGFGLALVEAQAAGLPVIAFDSGSIPEIVQKGVTGFLSTPLNLEEMAMNTKRLIADDVAYTSMSKAAIDWARSAFSLERLGLEYENMLMEILQKNERLG